MERKWLTVVPSWDRSFVANSLLGWRIRNALRNVLVWLLHFAHPVLASRDAEI